MTAHASRVLVATFLIPCISYEGSGWLLGPFGSAYGFYCWALYSNGRQTCYISTSGNLYIGKRQLEGDGTDGLLQACHMVDYLLLRWHNHCLAISAWKG